MANETNDALQALNDVISVVRPFKKLADSIAGLESVIRIVANAEGRVKTLEAQADKLQTDIAQAKRDFDTLRDAHSKLGAQFAKKHDELSSEFTQAKAQAQDKLHALKAQFEAEYKELDVSGKETKAKLIKAQADELKALRLQADKKKNDLLDKIKALEDDYGQAKQRYEQFTVKANEEWNALRQKVMG